MQELPAFLLRVALVTTAIVAVAFLVDGGDWRSAVPAPDTQRIAGTADIGTTPPEPIVAEAQVFRAPLNITLSEDVERRNTAHPRTLATFRALRAYPGAPPRVPHGLTAEEFRTTRCRTCHERGGYSMRFAAYAPVTPHPQLVDCLQCHVANDAVVGVQLSSTSADGLCRQCHATGAKVEPRVALTWRSAAWPQPTTAEHVMPPAIPHDLHMRSDCLTCHAGPGAVQEIRTRHPERVNCRQCHVAVVQDAAEFERTRSLQ